MRLYRHINLFRIFRNPCKQGIHSTARHFIPDNPQNVSNSAGSENTLLSQHKAYEMVKKLNEQDRDSLRMALNQFELDQIKIKFEGKVDNKNLCSLTIIKSVFYKDKNCANSLLIR